MNELTIGRELVSEALDAGYLLERHGVAGIRATSPLGCPLTDDLRARLNQHRDDVLTWLDYRRAATELLAATMARLTDAYPIGVRLDEPAWREARAAVTAAYQAGDLERLRPVLIAYERFATDYFAACAKDSKEARR